MRESDVGHQTSDVRKRGPRSEGATERLREVATLRKRKVMREEGFRNLGIEELRDWGIEGLGKKW